MVICGSEGRTLTGTGGSSRVATSRRRKLVSLSLTIASKAEKDNRFVHLGAFFARSRGARLTFEKGVKCAMLMKGANAAATASSSSTSSSTTWYGILVTRW